jgi:single-strand DNA-binding protein
MANNNTITLTGNLTREPELRFTNAGQAQARMGIAINRSWQNRQTGQWEERTSFFNVVAWGELAENVAHSLPKGCRVVITGRLEQREYQPEEGEKRSVIEVIADEIGPSLRWATATVEKNERKGAGEFGDGGGRPSQAPAPAEARSGGSGGSSGSSGGFSDDEEPF